MISGLQAAAAAQLPGVVHGGLEAQDVLVLVQAQLQQPETDPEPAEAMRFPDHDLLHGRAASAVPVGAVLQAKQGPHCGDVQPGPGPVQDPVKQAENLKVMIIASEAADAGRG
jgi:hypothetical protein